MFLHRKLLEEIQATINSSFLWAERETITYFVLFGSTNIFFNVGRYHFLDLLDTT